MADNTRVSGSVVVEPYSKERVAFDLAVRIATDENKETSARTRDYWLTLYKQSYEIVHGRDLEKIKAIK